MKNKKVVEAYTKVLEGYVVNPPLSNVFTEEKVNRDFFQNYIKDSEHSGSQED